MGITRISPEEALERMAAGTPYLDVRSVPEFEAGHPQGAFNVPISHQGPAGMSPNPDFLSVVEAAFPKETSIIVGCKMGGRSAKAANLLVEAGYAEVLDQSAGFEGQRDPFGQVKVAGWKAANLPVALEPEAGRSFSELEAIAKGKR